MCVHCRFDDKTKKKNEIENGVISMLLFKDFCTLWKISDKFEMRKNLDKSIVSSIP